MDVSYNLHIIVNTTKAITISSVLLKHALSGAQAQGVDLPRLLRKCGIPVDVFEHTESRLPLENIVKLLRYCNGVMNDEANGLLQSPMRLGSFRMMALAAVHSQNLGQALERCLDFYNLFANSFHYELKTGRRFAQITMKRRDGHSIIDDYAICSMLSVIHRFSGWFCNDRLILNQIGFDHPPPPYRKELHYMFYGAPVLFHQDINSISFDRHYLDYPVVQTEMQVESYVRRAPMDIFLPLDAGGLWTMDVRRRLKEAFASQRQLLSLEILAEEMSLTPQTLRRRLRKEGSSFDIIKSHIRRDIAIHHLGDNQLTMEDIAEAAGYTEPSSFIRAFKSWTGFTPLQFRKGLDRL
ncbi:AraC family transcriptional regulator [Endozoicomonas arenosclerae]|uniref:AraC family transcriptional regulator n=1 Tax=Endozoicomonas arenosclerae TaxID=1633495 RepID=UPI000786069D|nr:AraC family transcriptional regulator [Endozoicomonas arenosclerae]